MNRTPLNDWHAAHGGRMVDFAGWRMPIQYTSIIEEHQAVRERAGLFDISHMGRLSFQGPDACRLLDHLLTNDVERLKIGQVRYSLICHEDGGILDDVLVYRFEDAYQLVVNASNRNKIVKWIADHRPGYDVAVEDLTKHTIMLALQGPRAAQVVAELFPADVRAMGYYTSAKMSTKSIAASISRTGYTGEDGYEVIVPAANGRHVWDEVLHAGEAYRVLPCGLGCRDTLRLEAGMPLYGHELDESTDPFTAGLSFAVKLDAADFIGKQALRRIQERGVSRSRIGLRVAGRRIAREGALILQQDEQIGHVTSGTFSPTLNASIAMGYVRRESATVGSTVEVDIRGQHHSAEIVRLPFYSRDSPSG